MRVLIVGFWLLLTVGIAQADGSIWDELMTPEERAATGVERLSAVEQQALRYWLMGYAAGRAGQADSADRAEWREMTYSERRQAEAEETAEIRSRIDGDFTGWRGETVFRLENGQVWQQRRGGAMLHEAHRPEVIIRRNRLGFYTMEVPDAGRSVLVNRID